MSWWTLVTSLLDFFPALESLAQLFIKKYSESRIQLMKKENREYVKNCILQQDQRELEKLITGGEGGERSGIPGITERDSVKPRS